MSNKLIRIDEVLSRTGYSKSWTYKLIDKGEFPKLVKIGPRSGVLEILCHSSKLSQKGMTNDSTLRF
ncbi:helix-turn-helix transcriptional regulator [Xenorhabdus cabanillasii]|uniref:helix-turn-helix transcriptional regulator n=2 Tax=Xenorhabdus cabanillasii TaxID=351673 RepID=UPI000C0620F1|nr:AlpA family phage regulatory protein [Xenorhabdus cabanillasii]PHM75267.1 phage-related protein [Xenorhabdus cabanillasii JM26]